MNPPSPRPLAALVVTLATVGHRGSRPPPRTAQSWQPGRARPAATCALSRRCPAGRRWSTWAPRGGALPLRQTPGRHWRPPRAGLPAERDEPRRPGHRPRRDGLRGLLVTAGRRRRGGPQRRRREDLHGAPGDLGAGGQGPGPRPLRSRRGGGGDPRRASSAPGRGTELEADQPRGPRRDQERQLHRHRAREPRRRLRRDLAPAVEDDRRRDDLGVHPHRHHQRLRHHDPHLRPALAAARCTRPPAAGSTARATPPGAGPR